MTSYNFLQAILIKAKAGVKVDLVIGQDRQSHNPVDWSRVSTKSLGLC